MPKQKRPFAPVRDGVLEHHKKMTWSEIAVFHHLLNRANRSENKGHVGLCAGLTGRRLAVELGKNRNTTQRALNGLFAKGYIESVSDGFFIPKFNAEVAVIEANSQPNPTKYELPPALIGATGGSNKRHPRVKYEPPPVQIRATSGSNTSHPSLLRDVDVSEDVSEDERSGATAPPGPVHWDGSIQQVVIDEDWLRSEIEDYQHEAGVQLTRREYEHEAEQLRLKLLENTRLRACIRKADGKPSTDSQFKRLATFTAGWFKRAVRMKAERANHPVRASPNSAPARRARTDEALRQVMRETLEEEQREQ